MGRLCGIVCAAALSLIVAGCGSSGSNAIAKAGPISIASSSDGTGEVNSLSVASMVKLSMMPAGDALNAGVDWAVTCGGSPVTGTITNGSCGTLSPTHTADGIATQFTAPSVSPIGNTVIITATMTSNPSQSTSVTLTVLPQPVTIAILTSEDIPFPSSMTVNQTATIEAAVNPTSDSGIAWTATCGAVACGSFSPAISEPLTGNFTRYTAPSIVPPSGTVTITATSLVDTSKSDSKTITITSQAAGGALAISVSPSSFYVATTNITARTFHVTATVANDPSSAGVDWSLSCSVSSCGTFQPHTASGATMTYLAPITAPPDGKVTLKATATADATKFVTVTGMILASAPINVSIPAGFALPATITAGSQTTLEATVAPTPDTNGVDWTATCSSVGPCGSFSLSPAHTMSGNVITYTAPGTVPQGGMVTITASSSATATPSNPAIMMAQIVPPSPSIALQQMPPATMSSGAQTPISAIVTNDAATGGGVDWALKCNSSIAGECGFMTPYHTASGVTALYTAPPVTSVGTSVTITATSAANPSAAVSAAPIAIKPATDRSVHFVPSLPTQMQVNATTNLTATVTNDAAVTNDTTSVGVDWQVCASGCGFFTIKPGIPALKTATSAIPAVPPVTATTVSAWPNGLAIPYTAPAQPPSSGVVAVAASAHADTTKAISGTIAISPGANGPALSGVVQSGTQPVVGATVTLYAAGTSGYASRSLPLATAPVTDKDGNFTVPSGYNCPQPDSQMYLVATGGQVGANAVNPNLALMIALGNCVGVGSGSMVINEVTTIASAYAISPFASNDALNGNSSYLYLGTSSSNTVGLANAFAAVNNLVDLSTGQARSIIPSGNAAVPYAEINTLADVLNACVASSGGVEQDASACGTLFAGTNLLGDGTFGASIAPSDTLQAAFNIAQHPAPNSNGYGSTSGYAAFFQLATPSSPFQPILPTNPNDWGITLNYTSGGGLSPASAVGSFAIDAAGNLWITDTKAGSVIEWNAVGAAQSPSTGFLAGGGPIAIDTSGDVWVSGDGSLTELTNLGTPYPGSPFKGIAGGGNDMAIDGQNNVWVTTSNGMAEFTGLGAELSPANGFVSASITETASLAIDSASNVWTGSVVADENTASLAEFTNPGGQLIISSGYGGDPSNAHQIAADASGNIWVPGGFGGGFCEMPAYAGKGTIEAPSCQDGGGPNGGGVSGFELTNAESLALDGAGVVWVASKGGDGLASTIPANVLPFAPGLGQPGWLNSSTLANGPLRTAVDGSGNLWVLLANNTVTEYVGLAVPVVAPLSLGVKDKKLAAKP